MLKRWIIPILLLCFLIQGGTAEAGPATVDIRGFKKSLYPPEDALLTGVEPNVLFLLDVGSSMTFTPDGTMPLYEDLFRTNPGSSTILKTWPNMGSANYRAGLLEQATYGTGQRPYSSGTGNTYVYDENGMVDSRNIMLGNESGSGWLRWGRDIDESNNIIGDIDCYYSPDPSRPYLLTFRNSAAAQWNGTGAAPSTISAISTYLPGGSNEGKPVPLNLANQYLVPNDSRMYKMKLVLWRLTDQENAQMLSRMRMGMATSMQLMNWPTSAGQFDFYRVDPYKTLHTVGYERYSATQAKEFYDNNKNPFTETTRGDFVAYDVPSGKWVSTRFPHGTAPDWSSGIKEQMQSEGTPIETKTMTLSGYTADYRIYRVIAQYYASAAGDYGGAQYTYGGIPRAYYLNNAAQAQWLMANRAHLKVPFDYFYRRQDDGSFKETQNLQVFREYIDGIEQGQASGSAIGHGSVTTDKISAAEYKAHYGIARIPELPSSRYGMLGPHYGGNTGGTNPPSDPGTSTPNTYYYFPYPTMSFGYYTSLYPSYNASGAFNGMINPELFADGKTPLAMSIYGRDNDGVSGRGKYFHLQSNKNNTPFYTYNLSVQKGSSPYPEDWDLASTTSYAIEFGPLSGDHDTRGRFIYASGGSKPSKRTSWPNVSSTNPSYDITPAYATRTFTDYGGAPSFHGYVDVRRMKNSDGLMTGGAVGSVIDFFSPREEELPYSENAATDTRGFFPVTGSCQSNWLVVFTAGNDDVPNYDPDEAVRALYRNSKEIRGRKWDKDTGRWIETKFSMENGIRTMVVGFVEPPDPYNPDGNPYTPAHTGDSAAKVLRKMLTRMAREGYPDSDGNPRTDSEPYFANDVPQLLETLKAVLLRIYTDKLATGAPIIMAPYEEGDYRVAFSGAYTVKELDQWDSFFYKNIIYTSGPSTEAWEFNSKLAAAGTGRRLFAVLAKDGTGSASVKRVGSLSGNEFLSYAGVPVTSINDVDYDEFAEWLHVYNNGMVLGDMEHSTVILVGPPEAASLTLDEGIVSRDPVVYMQTNRGVLHAIDYADGGEIWGVYPPNVFEKRLYDMKYKDDSYFKGNGHMTLRSYPMALLDGMLSARDVRFNNGKDRTVLIGNLGYGGNGLYAMDVTEMDKASDPSPVFLWAIDNARYETAVSDSVKRWGRAGTGNVNRYDYSSLGLTVAATEMLRLAEDKTVGVLPGGIGYDLGASDHGKVLYVLDPEDGSIIQKIDEGGSYLDLPSGRSLGMGVTPITYVENDAGMAKEFYTSDTEGNLLQGNPQETIGAWRLKSSFRMQTVDGSKEPVITPYALLAGETSGGARWIFGSTADLLVPDYQEGVRELGNKQQFLWATDMNVIGDTPTVTGDLAELTYFKDGILPDYGTAWSDAASTTVGGEPITKGWYLLLRPDMSDDPDNPRDPEYATTAPYMYYGVLYFATFIPHTRDGTQEDTCPAIGDAKFYALDPRTGEGMWGDGVQAIVMKDIKIAGISAADGRLYIAVKVLKDGAAENVSGFVLTEVGGGGGIMAKDAINYGDGIIPGYTPNIPYIQYWRERF